MGHHQVEYLETYSNKSHTFVFFMFDCIGDPACITISFVVILFFVLFILIFVVMCVIFPVVVVRGFLQPCSVPRRGGGGRLCFSFLSQLGVGSGVMVLSVFTCLWTIRDS